MNETSDTAFSLLIGGPCYRLLERMGLLGRDLLPQWRAALILVTLAWLPGAILATLQGVGWNSNLKLGGYFADYSLYARFIIAVACLVIMEGIAERRISMMIAQLRDADLLTDSDRPTFHGLLVQADQRTSSTAGELVFLVVAYVISFSAMAVHLATFEDSWFGYSLDGVRVLSWAGWWTVLVSLPLFWFLVLRWFWRLIVWSVLLHGVSKLQLRLVATHPDQCGGIGFLAMFPVTFSLLVFAISCVTASVVLQEMLHASLSLEMVGALFAVWFLLMLMTFIAPLTVFTPLLMRLKVSALLEYGKLATTHNLAFEQRWIRTARPLPDLLGTPDISSLSDLGACYEAVRAMNTIPVYFLVFRQLLLAAGLPWLVIPLTQFPLLELLAIVSKAIF